MGSGGRPCFASRHRGAGSTAGCVRPAWSRGGVFERRAAVAAGSDPAKTVVKGRVRLLAFSALTAARQYPRRLRIARTGSFLHGERPA